MGRITINPITRLEGHGRIEIFLDEAGKVANAYLQVPELRGFERFCVGRAAEESGRTRPSYERVRTLVHQLRLLRRGPSTGRVLFEISMRARPPSAFLDHVSGVGVPELPP